MPHISRDNGVEIHWEDRGEGPLVVFSVMGMAFPAVFEALLTNLASDHRVAVWHPRGTGESTRAGPYDVDTDAADLAAVVEAAGPPALLLEANGLRSIRMASKHPALVHGVVVTGNNPALGTGEIEGREGLAGSKEVVGALEQLLERDYRAALRTVIGSTNPQMSKEQVRQRIDVAVKHISQEAALGRLRAQRSGHQLTDEAKDLGDRLAIVFFETPWATRPMLTRARKVLPDARIIDAADGPISRPDITADVVRDLVRHTLDA
jgi:pimeloyl-ACP methyl ester carboxylesterase